MFFAQAASQKVLLYTIKPVVALDTSPSTAVLTVATGEDRSAACILLHAICMSLQLCAGMDPCRQLWT